MAKGRYLKKDPKPSVIAVILTVVLSVVSLAATPALLLWGLLNVGVPGNTVQTAGSDLAVMDIYDMRMTNEISNALDGVLAIEKVYWLNDENPIAPEPNQDNFHKTQNPADLEGFLAEAKEVLGVENTLFSTDVTLMPGSKITYYLDETIMVITWKQVIHGSIYTMSEVKIAHPSQFRRILADGVYGSDKQYMTTQMATTVNAVTASSGDFYKFRPYGITVYNGQVQRVDSRVDTCFINEDGDLLMVRRGQIKTKEEAEQFVKENNVRFSLAFGPILIDNSQLVPVGVYPLGEVEDRYPRAALCKMGDLHYLLVASNQEAGYDNVPNIDTFAKQLLSFGCQQAYTLDGGQTAVIVTNDELINRPSYGYQRLISDIIYFGTAIPDGG